MLGRILFCSVFILTFGGFSEILPVRVSRAADPPVAASADNEDRPLDLAADLLLIRSRDQELLDQVRNKRVSVELRNTPLDHAITHLSELSGIPMQLDTIALEEAGIALDEPCSARVKDARVSSVLSRILSRLELGWTIENESLQVTSNDVIDDNLQTMVFAAADIVEWFGRNARHDGRRDRFGFADPTELGGGQFTGIMASEQPDEILTDLIQEHSGGFWEELDGAGGTVRFEGGLLTVHQALPVLLQIESFLKRLRSIQKRSPSMDVWAIPEGGFGWPENRKATEALRKRVSVKFSDTPLNEAVAYFGKELGIQLDIDVAALDEVGLLDNVPVSLTMAGTASAVLKQLLGNLHLTWLVQDDTLQVTTIEVAEENLFTVVADTRQLFATERFTDDGLTETIQFETNGLWEDIDGSGGTIRSVGGLTFIRQTQASIADVSVLLNDLKSRAALVDSSRAVSDNAETDGARSSGMETRFYKAETKEAIESLMVALTNFVFPDSWETNGGQGVMVAVGSKLVVRQTPEVHKAIAEFVRELQAAE
jgi:hypothetical protein